MLNDTPPPPPQKKKKKSWDQQAHGEKYKEAILEAQDNLLQSAFKKCLTSIKSFKPKHSWEVWWYNSEVQQTMYQLVKEARGSSNITTLWF